MADNNKKLLEDIENLQEKLSDTRSIASDIGVSLKQAFREGSDEAKRLGRELSTSLDIFRKTDAAAGSISVLLDKIAKKEATIKEINKQKTKLSTLESQILTEIGKVQSRKLTLQREERNLAEELEYQLGEQLRTLQEQQQELNEITKSYKEQNKLLEKSQKIWEGIKNLPIIALFKKIVDLALAADVQTTELAKSLGIGKDQARGLYQNFSDYAKSTGDAFVTAKKLMEAQSELSQQLGISVKYTDKQAEDFSRLTKLMGLSVEQAGKLARMSIVNGKSIEDTTKAIIKGSAASQRTNKISIDQREILKDVSNLSAGILVKFNQNPEALGRAVVEARKLGISLEEVDKIGDSLLDWQSSIQNELEAELITNKQINLEKARYAALTGDQATLMQEVANQAGSLAEYQDMNIIAQRSLSQAFGMSRDEMSKMLLEQEKINKLGDVSQMTLEQQLEALKAQGEPIDSVLYKQIQQQSIQEKFNNAIEKMQDLIGNLAAGPLGDLLNVFAEIASHAGVLYTIMGAIAAMSLVKTIASLSTMIVQLGIGAAEAMTMASAITLGLAIPAVILGIAAGMGAFSDAKEEASNVPKYAKGGIVTKPHVGMVGEAGPEAIVPLNSSRADQIFGGKSQNDNSDVIAAIKELGNRPSVAYINGKDAFADNVGRSRNLGTSQNINTSYKLA